MKGIVRRCCLLLSTYRKADGIDLLSLHALHTAMSSAITQTASLRQYDGDLSGYRENQYIVRTLSTDIGDVGTTLESAAIFELS